MNQFSEASEDARFERFDGVERENNIVDGVGIAHQVLSGLCSSRDVNAVISENAPDLMEAIVLDLRFVRARLDAGQCIARWQRCQ